MMVSTPSMPSTISIHQLDPSIVRNFELTISIAFETRNKY